MGMQSLTRRPASPYLSPRILCFLYFFFFLLKDTFSAFHFLMKMEIPEFLIFYLYFGFSGSLFM